MSVAFFSYDVTHILPIPKIIHLMEGGEYVGVFSECPLVTDTAHAS